MTWRRTLGVRTMLPRARGKVHEKLHHNTKRVEKDPAAVAPSFQCRVFHCSFSRSPAVMLYLQDNRSGLCRDASRGRYMARDDKVQYCFSFISSLLHIRFQWRALSSEKVELERDGEVKLATGVDRTAQLRVSLFSLDRFALLHICIAIPALPPPPSSCLFFSFVSRSFSLTALLFGVSRQAQLV